MKIEYVINRCSLGYVLLGATDKGVCALILGSDRSEVLEALEEYFPKAELLEAAEMLAAWGAEAVKAVDDPRRAWDLPSIPLDLQGTPFQHRVWEVMQAVPCGETTSYSEIALKLGMPTGARAVASACAANKVAVAVPCHRVIHGDGTLSGYRWGVERKKKLLSREGAEVGGQRGLL